MVRIGYNECASCHLSPQGGGPLNAYGRGIDKAQSLAAGGYQPSEAGFVRALNLDGRITHDLRAVMQGQARWVGASEGPAPSGPASCTGTFGPRPRVSPVGRGHRRRRKGAPAHGELRPPHQPIRPLREHRARPLSNREDLGARGGPRPAPERRQRARPLPYIKSRNRLGYYDAPTQVKMFWWSRRHAFTPFLYGPGGNEAPGERESGGGWLYEFDPIGEQRAKLGVTFLQGTSGNGGRRMAGAYARLGFGKWGILAEHDVTDRTRNVPDSVSFRQNATYGQVFWATREWLVASLIGERLHVAPPFAQHLMAGRFEIAARLTNQATLVANTRIERNMTTGRLSKSVGFQLALKTID